MLEWRYKPQIILTFASIVVKSSSKEEALRRLGIDEETYDKLMEDMKLGLEERYEK